MFKCSKDEERKYYYLRLKHAIPSRSGISLSKKQVPLTSSQPVEVPAAASQQVQGSPEALGTGVPLVAPPQNDELWGSGHLAPMASRLPVPAMTGLLSIRPRIPRSNAAPSWRNVTTKLLAPWINSYNKS